MLRDAYDEAAFAGLLDDSAELRECSRRGEKRLRSFPALLSDVFCLLFKMRPALVERTLVRPAFQVNRYLIARLAAEPEIERLRAGGAVLDEEAAAAGTLSVGKRLLRELTATDLAAENHLFELEEVLGGSGEGRERPAPVRRREGAGSEATSGGEGDGPACGSLPYDLQQRLEMAEALKDLRSFEHLLALARPLVNRLRSDDPTARQATEIYDIGLGDELSRLLPGELVSLRASGRRKDFLRKLLGRRLLTYQIRGKQRDGPLVALVDVSHSMAGEKELACKALAVALLHVAAERGQAATAMLFGPRTAPLREIDFHGRLPRMQQVVELADTFLGGGTDFERPVSAALDLIAKRGGGGGQIILISDGLCDVGEQWLAKALVEKARSRVRVLSVIIDIEPFCREVPAFADRAVRWSELMADRASVVPLRRTVSATATATAR